MATKSSKSTKLTTSIVKNKDVPIVIDPAPKRRPLCFKSYQELSRCFKEIKCHNKDCRFDWSLNRNHEMYINQFKAFCSIRCFISQLKPIRVTRCEHCSFVFDLFSARYSFATATGTLKCFCSGKCFGVYFASRVLCNFCSNEVPTYFIDAGAARFCTEKCMWASSSRKSGEICLTCRTPIEISATLLQHEASEIEPEHFCSAKCRLEFKAPFEACKQHDDYLALQKPRDIPLVCLGCCRPLILSHNNEILFGLGKRFFTCSEACSTLFKVMYRMPKNCSVCNIEKANSDMIEVLKPVRDAQSIYFCSVSCLLKGKKNLDTSCLTVLGDGGLVTTWDRNCLQCTAPLAHENLFYCSQQCMVRFEKSQLTQKHIANMRNFIENIFPSRANTKNCTRLMEIEDSDEQEEQDATLVDSNADVSITTHTDQTITNTSQEQQLIKESVSGGMEVDTQVGTKSEIQKTTGCSQTDKPWAEPFFLPAPVIFPMPTRVPFPLMACIFDYKDIEPWMPYLVNSRQDHGTILVDGIVCPPERPPTPPPPQPAKSSVPDHTPDIQPQTSSQCTPPITPKQATVISHTSTPAITSTSTSTSPEGLQPVPKRSKLELPIAKQK